MRMRSLQLILMIKIVTTESSGGSADQESCLVSLRANNFGNHDWRGLRSLKSCLQRFLCGRDSNRKYIGLYLYSTLQRRSCVVR